MSDGAASTYGAALNIVTPYTIGHENGIFFSNSNTSSSPPGGAITFYTSNSSGYGRGGLKFKTSTSGSVTTRMTIDPTGYIGIGTTTPSEKLEVHSGNLKVNTGQIYSTAQTSNAASPLVFDTNSGNLMVWTNTDTALTAQVHNMKPGGSYTLVVSGAGTGQVTINCYSDTGSTPLPSSFVPANGPRTNGTLNKSAYTLISDGTNCLITWTTGF